MALPQIVYTPAGTDVTLNFRRGPLNFMCADSARAHDNLSTSGLRERVYESSDLLISFEMPAVYIRDDYSEWAEFQRFALAGGRFIVLPNAGYAAFFHCVSDDIKFEPARKAVGYYGIKCAWRIVPDELLPANAGAVMQMYWAGGSTVAITTASLPSGTHAVSYSQSLAATGGTGTYAWFVVGGSLPAGMTLNSAGLLSGTPTVAGNYFFTAQVTSAGSAFFTYTLVIA